jgi:hypothetical protein
MRNSAYTIEARLSTMIKSLIVPAVGNERVVREKARRKKPAKAKIHPAMSVRLNIAIRHPLLAYALFVSGRQ